MRISSSMRSSANHVAYYFWNIDLTWESVFWGSPSLILIYRYILNTFRINFFKVSELTSVVSFLLLLLLLLLLPPPSSLLTRPPSCIKQEYVNLIIYKLYIFSRLSSFFFPHFCTPRHTYLMQLLEIQIHVSFFTCIFNDLAISFHPGSLNETYNSVTHFHFYSCSVSISVNG